MENTSIEKPFWFEAMWTRDVSSKEVVESAWHTRVDGPQSLKLAKKLEASRRDLKRWNKSCFGSSREKIKELEQKIAQIQSFKATKENLELEASLNLELDEWLAREDLKWKQKSREIWIREGDRNTRFFHLSTLIRRMRNYIQEIKLEDDSWINDREDIQKYFIENFKALYQTGSPNIPKNLESLIEPCILNIENEELCRVPTRDEIRKIIFEMKSLKALRLDGFPALFYKHYWEIVGDQIVTGTQSFFGDGRLLNEFNQTFISLIPKKKGACNFNQFWPISLCNVCYKVISKIIVNRLRPVLSKMVDPAQVAFVPNCWIIENMALA